MSSFAYLVDNSRKITSLMEHTFTNRQHCDTIARYFSVSLGVASAFRIRKKSSLDRIRLKETFVPGGKGFKQPESSCLKLPINVAPSVINLKLCLFF